MPGPGGAVADADLIGLGHVNLLPPPLLSPLNEQQEPSQRKEANPNRQHVDDDKKSGQESQDLQVVLVAPGHTFPTRNDAADSTEEIALSFQSWLPSPALEQQSAFRLLRVAGPLPSPTSSVDSASVPVERTPAPAVDLVAAALAFAQPRRAICHN
jgi:hypothetical protein